MEAVVDGAECISILSRWSTSEQTGAPVTSVSVVYREQCRDLVNPVLAEQKSLKRAVTVLDLRFLDMVIFLFVKFLDNRAGNYI